MLYITTTELRTKSKKLVKTLKSGGTFRLIHRSQIVGEIIPTYEPKPFDPNAFEKFLDNLKPKKLISRKNRDKVYRKHLEEKYGKDLP